jgi:hypothetical protein
MTFLAETYRQPTVLWRRMLLLGDVVEAIIVETGSTWSLVLRVNERPRSVADFEEARSALAYSADLLRRLERRHGLGSTARTRD